MPVEERENCLQASAQAVKEAAISGEKKKLWGGRFTGATDPLMEKFNESLPFDKRMWREDIRVRFVLSDVLTLFYDFACCAKSPVLLSTLAASMRKHIYQHFSHVDLQDIKAKLRLFMCAAGEPGVR